VWACGEGQTDTRTDGCDQYTFRLGYASREMRLLSIERGKMFTYLRCSMEAKLQTSVRHVAGYKRPNALSSKRAVRGLHEVHTVGLIGRR